MREEFATILPLVIFITLLHNFGNGGILPKVIVALHNKDHCITLLGVERVGFGIAKT